MNLSKQSTEEGIRYTLDFESEELNRKMAGALLMKIASLSQSQKVSDRLYGLYLLAEELER
jgi:hypothetical protein